MQPMLEILAREGGKGYLNCKGKTVTIYTLYNMEIKKNLQVKLLG
jgi:N6-adenosine-specific RNA methylase IME4